MHCIISGRMLVSWCPHSGEYWHKFPSSLYKDQKVFRMISIDEEFSGITPPSRWLRNYASRYPEGPASTMTLYGQRHENPWRLASGMQGCIQEIHRIGTDHCHKLRV